MANPVDRVLWPVFRGIAWLDTRMPERARGVAYRIGHRVRTVMESVAARTPIVRSSLSRWGDKVLEDFRAYRNSLDGLIRRDVQ